MWSSRFPKFSKVFPKSSAGCQIPKVFKVLLDLHLAGRISNNYSIFIFHIIITADLSYDTNILNIYLNFNSASAILELLNIIDILFSNINSNNRDAFAKWFKDIVSIFTSNFSFTQLVYQQYWLNK